MKYLFGLCLLCPMVFSTPISIEKRYTAIKIKSNRNNQCLSPIGHKSTWHIGTKVGTAPCDQAALWNASPGSGSVALFDTDLVLGAGTGTQDGESLYLAEKFPGSFQQTWYWTDDNRLAITGGNTCLDQGNEEEGTQIWQCTYMNDNQVWTLQTPTPENPPFDPPFGVVYDDPPTGGKRLHPYQRPDIALTLDGGYLNLGRSAVIAYSQPTEGLFADAQLLNLTIGINLHISSAFDTNTCLDVVANPKNGDTTFFRNCNLTTTWDWDGSRLRLSNTDLCLDVRAESVRLNQILKQLQVWECVENNTNQQFFTLS
ncbi:uncharacterized protein L201_001489 [Kwoniella dendrophila CBS 6074]|uniref:Ricin B lectin domain-containing protein n=1 Tax=Kwoniella dendrophila CBS 6074 TaxID=1295534 RepID=A0AAX4JMK0_9TREE